MKPSACKCNKHACENPLGESRHVSKVTGGPPTRFASKSTSTSTQSAILMNGNSFIYSVAVKDLRSASRAPDVLNLSLIHISEPTRRTPISYAVFCLKKKKT